MNFCEGCLSPRITASKPGADGREVSNLISCDIAAHRKGFMGEYFIRPPVDISLEFSVPIDISHIKLEARLEHMCSTGFNVFTKPEIIPQDHHLKHCGAASHLSNPSSSGLTSSDSTSSSLKPVASSLSAFSTSLYSENFPSGDMKGHVESSDSNREETDDIYFCVGKYFTQAENQILLKNPHYRHWMNIPLPKLSDEIHDSKVYNGAMRHPNRQALRCVKNMIIRITRTAEKGPPVLHSLEVWGQPGISTGKSERKKLLKKWADRVKMEDAMPALPRMYNSDPEERNAETHVPEALKTQDSLEVPEDFLDPLTCDIMTVPLLLPSGHSIDAHTLERFIANEASWGRPASDPFTGVPFKENVQPSPNVPLKARIDRFLLLHADSPEVQKSAHTVGSALSSYNQGSLRQIKPQMLEDSNSLLFTESRKRIHEEILGSDNSSKFGYHKNLRKERSDDASDMQQKNVSLKIDTESVKITPESDDNTLAAEIEAALQGKPKYVPAVKKTQDFSVYKRDNDSALEKLPVKSQPIMCKATAKRARLQALNHTANLIKKPTHLTPHGKGTSSGHHGLVQMIGGALSITHGRTVASNCIPLHRSNAKPASLICGDGKPQHFDIASNRHVTCSCGEKEGLYKLLCNHVICRTCLLQQTKGPDVECNVCEKVCKRLDVAKHHEKSIFSQ